MLKSMTGFGKSMIIKENKIVVVEIKSLNSKQLEINCRLASPFRAKENEIRQLIANQLERGNIDVNIYFDKNSPPTIEVNKNIAKTYYDTLVNLSDFVENRVESDIFNQILKFPEIWQNSQEEFSDDFWKMINITIKETCEKVNNFRIAEGEALATDFVKRIKKIEELLIEIEPYEESRIIRQKEKFIDSLEKLELAKSYDKNRLEQELIYFYEKLDLTEEKVRLKKHCQYFIEILHEEKSNGKKLGFIVQECGREINTIGSKCNDFNIQRIVVNMKDEIEKLKEQLFNIL